MRGRALISDSVFKQRIHTGVIHRPCYCVGVGAALVSLFPHMREGAERRLALRLSLHLAVRVPCGHAASRRSTVASSTPGPSRQVRTEGPSSPVIRAAFAALHPDRTGLLSKAALRSKGEREPRATRTSCVRVHRGAGATPAPPIKTPHDGALTRAGMRSVPRLTNGTIIIRITVFARWGWSVKPQWIQHRINTHTHGVVAGPLLVH